MVIYHIWVSWTVYMNSASQPDSSSEWSKFTPLSPRPRSDALAPSPEHSVGTYPDSVSPDSKSTILGDSVSPDPDSAIPGDSAEPLSYSEEFTHLPDEFACQNRKCAERRAKRDLGLRPLFSATWRQMKIGKTHRLVLDIAIRCPDCDFQHQHTLIPPELVAAAGTSANEFAPKD